MPGSRLTEPPLPTINTWKTTYFISHRVNVLILADQKYLPFAGPGARRIAVPGNFKTNESHRLDLEGK